jgi:hypothetical protein
MARIGPAIYSEQMFGASTRSAGECGLVRQLSGGQLDAAFVYNESGSQPHTMLLWEQITIASRTCGCNIIGHTRLFVGAWKAQVDWVLNHPNLSGVAMEIDITRYAPGFPVFDSASPSKFAKSMLAHGKQAFFLLPMKGDGLARTGMTAAQQMQAFLGNVSEKGTDLSNPQVNIVIARYGPSGNLLPVSGQGGDTVAAAVEAAQWRGLDSTINGVRVNDNKLSWASGVRLPTKLLFELTADTGTAIFNNSCQGKACATPIATKTDYTQRPVLKLDDSGPCKRCSRDWKKVTFVGIGPNGSDGLCSLVDTCASEVAECDWTQPPDDVFASCKNLTANASWPQPKLVHFKGGVTGSSTSTYYIEPTPGTKKGPFVLYFAPVFSGDWWNVANFYVFSHLATQGIATFVVQIPDAADAARDNWNHVPSAGARPYPYSCNELKMCENASDFLHDKRAEDIILYAKTLGYAEDEAVWWGFSEGAVMVSQHLSYLLQRNATAHVPKALVLEASGGQYCYAFSPNKLPLLRNTTYWNQCNPDPSWSPNNCCPSGLTEQYYYENQAQYKNHPAVLLIQAKCDLAADPHGLRFYHDTMRKNSARSATATWAGTAHGITPFAFGFAASYIKNALPTPAVAAQTPCPVAAGEARR